MPGPSPGEQLVSAYLRQCRLPFEREPLVGRSRPDFVAASAFGAVALEVFEPELRLPATAGSFDSVAPLLAAFRNRKRRQVQDCFAAGLATAIVIASTNSDVPFDVFAAAGAMFGRLGVRFPLHSADPGHEAKTAFLSGGQLQPERNTRYSAVAIVRRFNPTMWRLEAAWKAERLSPTPSDVSQREIVTLFQRRTEVEERLTQSGVFDPTAALSRLIILRNPYAQLPLSDEFGGPHDQHYGQLDGSWTCVATGRRWPEVPQ